VSVAVALCFRQELVGGYMFIASLEQRPIDVTLIATGRGFENRFYVFDVSGNIRAPDLIDRGSVSGTLRFCPRSLGTWHDWRLYADDGSAYEAELRTVFRIREPLFSLSQLTGDVFQESRPVGAVELRFDFRHELGRFLQSLSLRLGPCC
jgi:hypothetical protein